ncbi:MAG TPA: IPT/TIG domain-containing protein, partial [Streptomyces sp.]
AESTADAVSVLDTSTGTVSGGIAVGSGPQGLAVTPDGARLYVTNLHSGTVSVIDTATSTVTGTTPVGSSPSGVAVSLTPVPPVPVPVVTAVSPATGPPAGGTTVTVSGSHLAGATDVTFGAGHSATAVDCSDTSCTAHSPAGAVGTVDVQVTTAGGTSAISAADRFSYAAADAGVTLKATPVSGLLGGRIDYTVTVTDHGPSALTSATVTIPLSAPLRATSSDCSVGANGVTCTVGPLADNAGAVRHFSVPVGLLSLNLPYSVTAIRTASAPVDLNSADDRATRTCTVLTSLLISCD